MRVKKQKTLEDWLLKRSHFLIVTLELDDDLYTHLDMYVRKYFQLVGSLITQI